jgi:hypothetical protein
MRVGLLSVGLAAALMSTAASAEIRIASWNLNNLHHQLDEPLRPEAPARTEADLEVLRKYRRCTLINRSRAPPSRPGFPYPTGSADHLYAAPRAPGRLAWSPRRTHCGVPRSRCKSGHFPDR